MGNTVASDIPGDKPVFTPKSGLAEYSLPEMNKRVSELKKACDGNPVLKEKSLLGKATIRPAICSCQQRHVPQQSDAYEAGAPSYSLRCVMHMW